MSENDEDEIPDWARERLAELIREGENLPGRAAGPQPQTQVALRRDYLRWHDDVLKVVSRLLRDDDQALRRFESRRWELVLGDQVSEDRLTATILGDLDVMLPQLRRLLESISTPPPRVLPDPSTVGRAVYDANCLFSANTRRLLVGFAVYRVVEARWSRKLIEETGRSLARNLRGSGLEDFGRWLREDAELVRDGLVTSYEHWCAQLNLKDPDDVHVLAAAIHCGATTIVTHNLQDFPADVLEGFEIEALHPDDFALRCVDANPVLAVRIVEDQPDPEWFLDRLADQLPKTGVELRQLASYWTYH